MLRERKRASLHRRALPRKRRGDLQSDAGQRILTRVAQSQPCTSGEPRGCRHDADVKVIARDANGSAVSIGELRRRVRRSLFLRFGWLLIGRCGSIAVALVEHLTVRRRVDSGCCVAGAGVCVCGEGAEFCAESLRNSDTRECKKQCATHTTIKQIHDPKPLRGLCGLDSVGAGTAPARRCRIASYITTAPATDTFSELTLPAIGMRSRKSQVRLTRS